MRWLLSLNVAGLETPDVRDERAHDFVAELLVERRHHALAFPNAVRELRITALLLNGRAREVGKLRTRWSRRTRARAVASVTTRAAHVPQREHRALGAADLGLGGLRLTLRI